MDEKETTMDDTMKEITEISEKCVDLFYRIHKKAMETMPPYRSHRNIEGIPEDKYKEAYEIASLLCPKPMEIVAWLSQEPAFEFPDDWGLNEDDWFAVETIAEEPEKSEDWETEDVEKEEE